MARSLLNNGLLILLTVSAILASPLEQKLTSLSEEKDGYNIWAVIVAGSNGYDNYRHQADVCHAYQVLINHGVSPANIIVMMYDDIAENEENPYKGTIINQPGGKDVYQGVSKEYIGDEVTPANFLGVLKGDKALESRGKKVLKSGPNDHVFVYFADHGAVGLLGFPEDILSSNDFMDTLKYMSSNSLYGKMTVYIEACESGSMFDGLLPSDISIFATTAANPEESSYAVYFDNDRDTYLGDEYSVNWLEDSDSETLSKETLEGQFKIVKEKTKQSHAQQYGDLNLASLDVGQFQGEKSTSTRTSVISNDDKSKDAVSSRLVPLEILRRKIAKSNDQDEIETLEARLHELIAGRKYLHKSVKKVIGELCEAGHCSSVKKVLKERKPLRNHRVYGQLAREFHESCFNLGKHSYGLELMYAFANIVEGLNLTEADQIRSDLKIACGKHVKKHHFEAIV